MGMTRTPLIAGNWKMNIDHLQAVALVQKLHWSLKDASHEFDDVDVTVFPPFTDLRSVQTLIDADKIPFGIGAQDLSEHDSGAYTGEISGEFLAKLNIGSVIIGHSERREYHAEDDRVVAAKTQAALKHGLVPVICVGETSEDLEKFGASAVPVGQLRDGARERECRRRDRRRLRARLGDRIRSGGDARAGAGRVPEAPRRHPREARQRRGRRDARAVRRFREVEQHRIASCVEPDIDGALVGGGSLKVDEFSAIVRFGKHVGV